MKFWNFKNIVATETALESVELKIEGNIVDDGDAWIYEWYGETCTSPNAFKDELSQLGNKDLTVWVDSHGGSVFAGAGIYNALKEYKGKITMKVEKAMSIASVIAMAGDELLMSPVGLMMIHNPITNTAGYASDLRKTADVLDAVKEIIVNAYQLKTKLSRNKISQLMDNETYMSAKSAIKDGFADGMLYGDLPETEISNFVFSRSTVLNSTDEAVRRMIEMNEKPKSTEVEKLKLSLQLAI